MEKLSSQNDELDIPESEDSTDFSLPSYPSISKEELKSIQKIIIIRHKLLNKLNTQRKNQQTV